MFTVRFAGFSRFSDKSCFGGLGLQFPEISFWWKTEKFGLSGSADASVTVWAKYGFVLHGTCYVLLTLDGSVSFKSYNYGYYGLDCSGISLLSIILESGMLF